MAAPNINYAGTWTLNRQDSDSPEPLLSLQGIGYFIRKSIALATIRLQITQHEDPPLPPNSSKEKVQHIVCSQTASGLKGTSEYHCADNQFRDHSDWLFGAVRGRAEWVDLEELDEPFLKAGWNSGAQNHAFIFITVESRDDSWVVKQVWGLVEADGLRRLVRRVIITKEKKRTEARFVYDCTMLV